MIDLYIVQLIDVPGLGYTKAQRPFRIIERIRTVDGIRDRISEQSFGSLVEAATWIADHAG